MARLGNRESGKTFYGEKTKNFTIEQSRSIVEHSNQFSVLYFEVDYEKSKRNFYGELIVRKWKNVNGIKVLGIIKLEDDTVLQQGDIPNKMLKLEFGCYIDHLKELNIKPQIGDYFSVKNRTYYIYDKTTTDSNWLTIGTDSGAHAILYKCVQSDSEQQTAPGMQDQQEGTKNQIEGKDEV